MRHIGKDHPVIAGFAGATADAMMLVADKHMTRALTGTGDVLEPEHKATENNN